MIKKLAVYFLVAASTFIFYSLFSDCRLFADSTGMSEASDIPEGLGAEDDDRLRTLKGFLDDERGHLETRRSEFNAQCGHVSSNDTAAIADCTSSRDILVQKMKNYANRLAQYELMLNKAKNAMPVVNKAAIDGGFSAKQQAKGLKFMEVPEPGEKERKEKEKMEEITSRSALEEARAKGVESAKEGWNIWRKRQESDKKIEENIKEWRRDPAVDQAIRENEALWKEAEAEYEKRETAKKTSFEPQKEEKFDLFEFLRERWPGPKNPEPPIESDQDKAFEKELKVLKIFKELKEKEAK